jgi:hypothetical protein
MSSGYALVAIAGQTREVECAVATPARNMGVNQMRFRILRAIACAAVLSTGMVGMAVSQEITPARLEQINAMSPEKMARTGAWTRANYDKMMGYIYSIEDRGIRSLVLDFVNNPRSTVFDATVDKNAYRYAPAAGGPGHHFYPGGLAVHAVENIEISLGWSNVMSSIHGVNNVNRDIIIASLVLHDWAKVWYNWDEKNGVSRPTWFPEYWGGQEGIAKWKWMGGHGAIVYAELMKRGAPAELIIGTAAAHFDAYWDLDRAKDNSEGLNAALAEAAKLAKVPAIKVDPAKRMAEWFMIVYSDGSWSYSHYVAGQFAHNWIREVAQENGIDPKSPQANRLAQFVLTRISDFKLYSMYQGAKFDASVPKKAILSILKDSAPYEVPES